MKHYTVNGPLVTKLLRMVYSPQEELLYNRILNNPHKLIDRGESGAAIELLKTGLRRLEKHPDMKPEMIAYMTGMVSLAEMLYAELAQVQMENN